MLPDGETNINCSLDLGGLADALTSAGYRVQLTNRLIVHVQIPSTRASNAVMADSEFSQMLSVAQLFIWLAPPFVLLLLFTISSLHCLKIQWLAPLHNAFSALSSKIQDSLHRLEFPQLHDSYSSPTVLFTSSHLIPPHPKPLSSRWLDSYKQTFVTSISLSITEQPRERHLFF